MHRWSATILTLLCLVFVPVLSAFAQAQRPAPRPQPVCCCADEADAGCCCATPEPVSSDCDRSCPADSCPLSQPSPTPGRAPAQPTQAVATPSPARPAPKRTLDLPEPAALVLGSRTACMAPASVPPQPARAPHTAARSVLNIWLT